ncbi:MAG: hypothetical protein ACD_12C00166G0002 [uncultured bacterium]|nr:MAG: hypothetical protein ACD_12C00166G0002 [uncultured bacterium]
METGLSTQQELQLPSQMICPAEKLMLLDDTARCLQKLEQEKPDMIYFLDKSARPLYWLLRLVYPKELNFPQVRFLNIGTEKKGDFEFVLEYSSFPELKASERFSPQKIMVLDDVIHSGESVEKAAQIIKKKYHLNNNQVIKYGMLSAFPSWIRKSLSIGVADTKDTNLNPLSQPTLEYEISQAEAQLIDRLKALHVSPNQIDKHIADIYLDDHRRKELKRRLQLILDVDRQASIKINETLDDWEITRNPTSRALRNEISQVADVFEMFRDRYAAFSKIEDEIKSQHHDEVELGQISTSLPVEWDSVKHQFTCDSSALDNVASKVTSGDISITDAMRIYYLIKYNRLHPDDWQSGMTQYYDMQSPSLNHLAGAVIRKLVASNKYFE